VDVSDDVEESDDDKRPSRRVADLLLEQIQAGTYAPGELLPPYRQLAQTYSVATNTAMSAVRLLRDEGYVTIRPNSGARVQDKAAAVDPTAELAALQTELSSLRVTAQRLGTDLATLEAKVSLLAEHLTSNRGV
jgi:DNA-binding GntR family transcriptional regulator